MTGSAGQRRVPAKFLETLLAPYPPLKTQERIVRILERGKSAVQFAVQSRACSQQLPQSIFLELFGDPVKNPKGWKRHTISQIVVKDKGAIKIGPFGSQLKKSELTEDGYKVYGQDNVISEDFTVGDRRISAGKFESMAVYELLPGDVVITMMGTIGKTAIVPDNIEEGIMDSHLIRIRLDKRVIDPSYFIWVFRHAGIQQQVLKGSHGAIMSGLNSTIVRNLAIPVPPLDLQRRFTKLVRGAGSIREFQSESEISINGLFDALVADAFKGELVV
jgi:type I restriction enzyme S subunit